MQNNQNSEQIETVNEQPDETPVEVASADKRTRLENLMRVMRMLDKREQSIHDQRQLVLKHLLDEIGKTFIFDKTVYQVRPRKGKLHLVRYFSAT